MFLNRICMTPLTANLGDVNTTVCHPETTTTHGRLNQVDRDLIEIGKNLIRISVKLESIKDIKADCERGYQASKATVTSHRHRLKVSAVDGRSNELLRLDADLTVKQIINE